MWWSNGLCIQHLEADDLKPNSGSEADGNEEADPAKTEKKGKFMVTTISNGNGNGNAKKPKFTVTTVNDDGNAASSNNLEPTSPLANTKKPKSRFQVTQVDDWELTVSIECAIDGPLGEDEGNDPIWLHGEPPDGCD